jgi:hypothetical protein
MRLVREVMSLLRVVEQPGNAFAHSVERRDSLVECPGSLCRHAKEPFRAALPLGSAWSLLRGFL